MLAGKRSVRVGDQILKEMADLLMRRVKDPRVRGATLTAIELSSDLKHAKVYYSVIGEQEKIRNVQAGLDSAKGFIKREIGFRMDLKYVPDIVFRHDQTLEKGDYMERLFTRIKGDDPEQAGE